MAEIVNLRLQRKRAQRTAKDDTAAENRLRFGRTKNERQAQTRESERADRLLDGHAREAPSGLDGGR